MANQQHIVRKFTPKKSHISYGSSSVDLQIALDASGKRTNIVLQRIPVATVKCLPLRRGVCVPERCYLERAMQEIGLGYQMSLGQEVIVGKVNVLFGQTAGAQQNGQGITLYHATVHVGDVNTAA